VSPPEGLPSVSGRSRMKRKVVLGGLISYVTSECHATEEMDWRRAAVP
jgi:hypothetical protein